MFPEELPKRLIKMFSFVDDIVLDPFLGSGTTSLAAKNLNRNSVGYEINENYLSIIQEKLNTKQNNFFQKVIFEILKQEDLKINFRKEIDKLPYLFKDKVIFDKKIDPKILNFGSKIDNTSSKRDNYFIIKNVISPEVLILNNGLKIKLLGIKETKENREKAIKFLKEKTNGNKVFIKFDDTKYDEENILLCYLYLQNKTFLNAHLIKNRLVEVDTARNYKYKSKFLSYIRGN